jgi:hypothetical protein
MRLSCSVPEVSAKLWAFITQASSLATAVDNEEDGQ